MKKLYQLKKSQRNPEYLATMYHPNSEVIFNFQMLSDRVEKIEDQDVHIWLINRNVFSEQKNYADYFLNEDEQYRAQRFQFRKHHDLFVIGRYFTRIMLAYYTGCSPENVNIITDFFGKPACEMNLFFNISHSGDHLLVGFSNSEIGVDIERINPTVDIQSIAESHFSEIELQKMMNCISDKRTDTFFEIWTKKESLIKGIGKGLAIPLQDFSVINPNRKVLWEMPTKKTYENWYVQNIESTHGYKSALATQYDNVDISYFLHD